MAEIQEAKSLRWLANMFPFFKNPEDDGEKMSNAIHLYAIAGANKIEQLAEELDKRLSGMRNEEVNDETITNPEMLERHMAYVEKFALNHGLTREEASSQPMVKAHAVFCANSHPDIFKNYMKEVF